MGNLQTKTRVKLLTVFSPVDSFTQLSPKAWLGFLQVMSLSPAPLSLLIKAAPILTEEMYGDIQPAAWELLLSVDEHMAGAAGKGTKPLRMAAVAAQLAAGPRTLQFCSGRIWMPPRVSWGLFRVHRPLCGFVLCGKEVVRRIRRACSLRPWMWWMFGEHQN